MKTKRSQHLCSSLLWQACVNACKSGNQTRTWKHLYTHTETHKHTNPINMTNTAKHLPSQVCGYMSPYPVVVMVVTVQYMATGIELYGLGLRQYEAGPAFIHTEKRARTHTHTHTQNHTHAHTSVRTGDAHPLLYATSSERGCKNVH